MLWNSRESLIQNVLERVVVGADDEVAAPEIGTPMAYRLNKADQLTLIGRDLQMSCCERLAVECQRTGTMM
jgi:hypothetical protein